MSAEEKVEGFVDEQDKEQFDASKLMNKNPGKHYRWARNHPMTLARHRFNGYEVVDSSSDPVRSVLGEGTKMKKGTDVDTAIVLGDMVLMSTNIENHERLQRRRKTRIQRMAGGVADKLKQEGQRSGMHVFEEHRDTMSGKAGEMTAKEHNRLMHHAERGDKSALSELERLNKG